jgi:hypothetical protein
MTALVTFTGRKVGDCGGFGNPSEDGSRSSSPEPCHQVCVGRGLRPPPPDLREMLNLNFGHRSRAFRRDGQFYRGFTALGTNSVVDPPWNQGSGP